MMLILTTSILIRMIPMRMMDDSNEAASAEAAASEVDPDETMDQI